MGFNCIDCGERDVWCNESNITPRLCKDCERLREGKEKKPEPQGFIMRVDDPK